MKEDPWVNNILQKISHLLNQYTNTQIHVNAGADVGVLWSNPRLNYMKNYV